MKILILTTRFPYGTWHETFFEPEFHAICSAFEEVHVLPLKGGELQRTLPENVRVWEPLQSRRWRFYLRQLISPSTWVRLARLLTSCARDAGIGRQSLRNCIAASCIYSAFGRHKRLKSFVQSEGSLVVYSYWGHFPALAIPIAKSLGAPTCVRYHSVDLYLEHDHNQGFIPYREYIQSSADLNVLISDHGLKYFNKHAGADVRGGRIVSRLGSPDYGPTCRDVAVATGGKPIVMASVSSIGGVKRVHLIARLAKELARDRPVEWHHFGSGQCDALEKELAAPESPGLKVKMWGDTPRSEIQRFFREARIALFVNLSEFEGVPVSIMEALNADIPVVASDVGGSSEIVIDGLSGMLVRRDDCERTDQLAARILEALGEDGLLTASSPRKVWQKHYDADANAGRMLEHLQALASKGAHTAGQTDGCRWK